jgi:glycosyltransferase involved in cell wall biosynthesis
MLASVILCTLRRAAQIGATLDSLLALPRPPGLELELVVVENGPPDGTRTEVERRAAAAVGWKLRYLHVEQKGKSRALNAGLAAARGELLFFVDDDLRFSPRWLTDLSALIISGRADGATSPITIPAHLRRPWMTPYHLGWLGCIRYQNQAQPDEMPGANMALHRRALDRVPAFDLELGGGGLGNCEDTLFSRQVVAAGFRLAFAPEAPVEHHFEPAKLRYAQWQANAAAAGRSRAYLHHHWLHLPVSRAGWRRLQLRAKLALRRSFTRSRSPETEGIPPWELSYRTDLAFLEQFALESAKPRQYALRGLQKLGRPGQP